ncbi:MAG: hypothetical protein ACK4PR_13635, partial [Gammaproteobacteria bacterium]
LVNTNANIQGIAVIPVNMEILCAIAGQATTKTTDIQRFASLTISDIYLEVLVFIFRRYHQNTANHSSLQYQWDKLNEEDILADMESRGVLPILSRLAKDLFVKNQLLFDAETLDRAIDEFIEQTADFSSSPHTSATALTRRLQLKEQIIATGLINGIRQEAAMHKEQGYFLHLTIQEFLMAWWCAMELVDHAEQELKPAWQLDLSIAAEEMSVEQMIAKYKYHPFYALVWPFVAGILTHGYTNAKQADKTKYRLALDRFIELIESEPCIVLGNSHSVLLLSCMTQIGRFVPDLSHQWLVRAQSIFKGAVLDKFILAQAYEMPCREWVKESYEQVLNWICDDKLLLGNIISAAGANQSVLRRLQEITFNQDKKYTFEMRTAVISSLGKIAAAGIDAEAICQLLIAVLQEKENNANLCRATADGLGRICASGIQVGPISQMLIAVLQEKE